MFLSEQCVEEQSMCVIYKIYIYTCMQFLSYAYLRPYIVHMYIHVCMYHVPHI
jgi:hypothetical protein